MRKIVAKNQRIEIAQEEIPLLKPAYILVKTKYSVISPGTELGMIENSSDREVPLGYSAMGEVVECGEGINNVKKGDLVACYGAPYVHHGEYLLVPRTLYAKVPKTVEAKEAALAGIGAIAIHALRIAKLQFGETIVVVGLGMLGQMIAKIANAAAYHVIACDLYEERVTMLAHDKGIRAFSSMEQMEEEILRSTGGHGADAVLLCTGGKRSPLTYESLKWIRNKGKVVIVGDVEPDFPRNLMFGKEAELLISRAGGPGRYDEVYEKQAIDYPYGFVRWTEGRNIAEYIRLVDKRRIDVQPLLKTEIAFNDVLEEFAQLRNKKTSTLTKIIRY
ncbi:zinc-dependent alcohol dehydrogenase [Lederbergia galactosidilytica]|uniref:Alcohol dehydrogenase n=1 Tax=Lederbergia galactosidilytica TaxID=217031 RepID=A0A0Q9YKL0_9BACI|nr:zinc-binding alcohol dehydrogenase [Lederbergia galactosidilytica]KRG16803.1 alcohol dehydrogenase [Lederbergia galactosidilytica]OAK67272.1 alcohol dehydrogenase [Lederbergia galactosidilytica]